MEDISLPIVLTKLWPYNGGGKECIVLPKDL